MKHSEKTKAVFAAATDLAKRMSGVLGTEHILYGLLVVDGTSAQDLLFSVGLYKEDFRCTAPVVYDDVNVTERAKRVVSEAQSLATMMDMQMTEPEHVLFTLLDEKDSYAMNFFFDKSVDVTALQRKTYAMLMNQIETEAHTSRFEDFDARANAGVSTRREQRFSVSEQHMQEKKSDISEFGVDLTKKAKSGKLDPVIGRGKETERVIQVLCRRTKNNPVLIGEPGVGKSAVVEGLAQAIANGNVPDALRDKRVFSLDVTSLVAGTRYRGDFEDRMKKLLQAIREDGNVILFIDEIHSVLNAGSSEDGLSVANMLKPMLARGEQQTIGATTIEEYRKYIEKDSALERRFQPVTVEEPSPSDTIEILHGLREKYEAHHGVKISNEAISAAALLSDRYVTDRFLPDKAIDLIDEAASKKNIYAFTTPREIRDIEAKINQTELELEENMRKENFEKCGKLKALRDELSESFRKATDAWKEKAANFTLTVGEDDIAEVVCSWTGIPVSRITDGESAKLAVLESSLQSRIIGQSEACGAVARAVKRARAGLKDPKRPIGSFVFLGPTGVGKTALAKALAGALFGDDEMIVRVDMSEYMEKESVSRLIGSAPGLVGFEEGGQLTEKVRRKPYSVVLFDEIEKGHPDIYNLLLQILEDGVLTDSHGRAVSFKNTVVILTSNIGAVESAESRIAVGFSGASSAESEAEHAKERQLDALKKHMKPEIVNRIDEVIVFEKLGKESLVRIADIMFDMLAKRLDERGITIEITDGAKLYVVNCGYDPEYGARPLRRTIQRLVEDKLSEKIIAGEFFDGDKIRIDADGASLTFEKVAR